MDYAEYKKLRQDILEECNKQLEALDMVWRRIQAVKSPSKNTLSTDPSNGHQGPPFADSLRIVIKGLNQQDFTADDVQQGLIDHGFAEAGKINRLAITNSLHRLYRRGEIEVIRKGQGKQGSVYRHKAAGEPR